MSKNCLLWAVGPLAWEVQPPFTFSNDRGLGWNGKGQPKMQKLEETIPMWVFSNLGKSESHWPCRFRVPKFNTNHTNITYTYRLILLKTSSGSSVFRSMAQWVIGKPKPLPVARISAGRSGTHGGRGGPSTRDAVPYSKHQGWMFMVDIRYTFSIL